MKRTCLLGALVLGILGSVAVHGASVSVCNDSGSTNVRFTVEYNKPYWTVGRGRSSTNRIFRYEEVPRRIIPILGFAFCTASDDA